VRILLDTHVALWAIVDDARLAPTARELIASPANTVMVSAVNVWEIAIKRALGRGDMPASAQDALGFFRAAGFELLPVAAEHAAAVETLPPIHADPFDRLLVAQAMAEPLRLLTHDTTVARYSDSIILV
jgi:PIN domain nuclease of toxin-antitoxin system